MPVSTPELPAPIPVSKEMLKAMIKDGGLDSASPMQPFLSRLSAKTLSLKTDSTRSSLSPRSTPSSTSTMPTPPPLITFAQACDLCRKMKIKCERKGDKCTHCQTSGTECTFAPVERKPPKVKRPELLESMEQRIERMEAILSATCLQSKSSRATSPDDADDSGLAGGSTTILVAEDGTEKFVGSTSALSIFSSQGLQWLARQTASEEFNKLDTDSLVSNMSNGYDIGAEWFLPFAGSDPEPLPKKAVVLECIDHFFKYVNDTYPIYNKDAFMSQLSGMYSSHTLDNGPWCACLNAVLAMGTMLQQASNPGNEPFAVHQSPENIASFQAWHYFRNASSQLVDLMFKPSLMGLQAILTMASMLQLLPPSEALSNLVSSAAQLSQRLGLHASATHGKGSPQEAEQRRNVFWLTFMIDQSVAIRTGTSPHVQEDDVGVRVPSGCLSTSSSSSSSPTSESSSEKEDRTGKSIFHANCELALLQARLYRELHSPRSRLRSQIDRITSLSQIDTALQSWLGQLPPQLQPNNTFSNDHTVLAHVLLLQISYLDTLCILHRASPFNRCWFTSPSHPPSPQSPIEGKGRVYASTSICTIAARRALGWAQRFGGSESGLPQNARDGILHLMAGQAAQCALSAALTLIASLISNPEDSQAESDLALLQQGLSFLSSNISSMTPPTMSVLSTLHSVSTSQVQLAANRSLPRSKRTRGNNDNVRPPLKMKTKEVTHQRRASQPPSSISPSASASIKSPGSTLSQSPHDMLLTHPVTTTSAPMQPASMDAMMRVSPNMLISPSTASASMDEPLMMPGDVVMPLPILPSDGGGMHGLGVDMSGGLDAQYVDMTPHGHTQHMDLHAEGEGWECSPIHHGGQHADGEWWHQQQHQHHAGGQGYEDVIVSAGPTPVLGEGGFGRAGVGEWDGEWEGSEGLALTPIEGAGLGHVPTHGHGHAGGMMMPPPGGIGMDGGMEFMAYA